MASWQNAPIASKDQKGSSPAWMSAPAVDSQQPRNNAEQPAWMSAPAISDQPQQRRPEQAEAAEQSSSIQASDFVLEMLEGGVSGVGSVVGGTGDFLTLGGNLVEAGLRKLGLGDPVEAGDSALGGMAPSDAFQAFENWMQRVAEQIDESQTEAFREAMRSSTPGGDLFEPSTWTLGDDPSVAGYAAQIAGLIGQFAPQAAALLAGTPQRIAMAMALVGGAQAGGSQANEAEERILAMGEKELSEASGLYRDLREGGLSHEEAQQQTAKTAGAAAFLGAAPLGAAGGALTSYVLGPLQRSLGGSLGSRLVNSVAIQGPGEAMQEVSETMLARQNTNIAIAGNQDISEGTFGDAALGGMFGTGLGVAGAVGGGLDATPDRTPDDAVRERTPEDIAALNEHFERTQDQRRERPVSEGERADHAASRTDGKPTPVQSEKEREEIGDTQPDGSLTPTRVPVNRIEVDPEAYQFRTEVNEGGVDSRLEGVEGWDDLRAGNLLLHEREDGRIFVADGHHRVDLARRLGQPDINAIVLREADGVSVEDARRLAAEANIAAGNATATDAAKVFRNSEGAIEDVIAERNLPRRSQLVRDGADLARLGDDAFGAVLNRVINEKDGAAIGRAFDDPDQQLAAVDVFRRVQPQNENQRALLVNEVRQADFAEAQGGQGGLFGDDPVESLIGERVRVMDRLRQELMRDRRLFATLNRNAQTAEQAGNRIATEQNEALQDASARAIALLERATTTPEINQQINDAARRVSEGQPVAEAASELKEVLLRGTGPEAAQPDRSPAPSGGQAEAAGRVERGDQRAPAQDDTRAEGAGQQRLGGAEGQGVTLNADGTPFQTRRAVELSRRFRESPGAVPVEVDGGWGFAVPDAGTEQGAQILETQTEESLAAREREIQQANQVESEQRRQEAERAQADAEVGDSRLSGSDLSADEAMAGGQETLFSVAEDQEVISPPAAESVREALAGMQDRLGDFTVIDSARELPEQAILGMTFRGINPRDVKGLYLGDTLYIIAANNDSLDMAVRTAVHEAVGRKGMRAVLGDDLVPVMRQLFNRLPHSKIGRQARNEVRDTYSFLDWDNPDDQVTIAEVMVVHLIEEGHRPRAWQRAVAKIKELLRRLFPFIPWTTTDALELGEKSRAWLQRRQAKADDGQADDMSFALRRLDTSRISDEFSDLTPDGAEALDMIGPLGVTGSALSKAREVFDRAAVKMRAGLFDKYAALKWLDEQALGRDFIETSTTSSSWILARMAPAAQGALHTMLHNGRIRLDPEQKVLELREGASPGLAGVLAQLGDAAEVTRFMGWIAGNRAKKLAEQGRENYFEPRHITALMELNSGRTKQGKARRTLYAQVFGEFQQYRDDVLAIAEQAGLFRKAMSEPEAALAIARKYGAPEAIISKLHREKDAMQRAEDGDLLDRAQARYAMAHQELMDWLADMVDSAPQRLDAIREEMNSLQRGQREMWAEEFYVPFYRVLDENTNDVQGPASTGGLTRQRAYKRLKGADMRIGDLLENTLMNYHHLLSASMKNLAATQAIDNAESLGIAQEVPEGSRDPKSSTFILRDGQQVYYEISDDLVYKALVNMTDAGMQALMNSSAMKTMRWFKRLLTNMVTVTPEFVAANTIRDSLQSAAVTPAGMNPLWNAVRGSAYYANKNNRAKMIASGGSFIFGHLYGNRSDELKAQLKRNLRDVSILSDPVSALKAVKWSWRRWKDATGFAENINRAKVYETNLDKGKLYAAFQSRDLMDFSSHGSWFMTRFLIDTVPFLNARLQGLDKLYRDGFKPTLLTAFGKGSESDKIRAKRFSVVTGALMVASIGLYLHNQDDEDYQALEDWKKDTYWFFKFGDAAFFVPKPFEVGAIATMAERMTELYTDENAGGELFKERLWHMITQTFAFSPVPQMAAPILDVYANRDPFRDRPIESYWEQTLSPSLRFRSSSTMQMRWLSEKLENAFGDDSFLSPSPKQLDYLWNGYLGSVGSYAAGIADTLWRSAQGIEAPDSRWTESKPIRRFYRDLATPAYYTRYQTLFYEGLREANRVYADVKKLEKLGQIEEAMEIAENKGDWLRIRKALNDARRDLSDIGKRMDQVKRDPDMSAEYKRRELERLRTLRNRITEVLGKDVEQLRNAG